MTGKIVLVHGFGSSAKKTWKKFTEILNQDPGITRLWEIAWFDYPTVKLRLPLAKLIPRIQLVADGLRSFINNQCSDADEIALIGHSMGGLVARKYIVDEFQINPDDLRVSRLLLFAVPNTGAELARWGDLINTGNPQIKQIQPKSEFIQELNAGWENLEVEKSVLTRYVVAGQDPVVSEQSARLHWGSRSVEVAIQKDHSTIVRPDDANDIVVSITKNLLRQNVVPRASTAIQFSIPPGWNFQQVATILATTNHSVVDFGSLTPAELNCPIQALEIQKHSVAAAIRDLRLLAAADSIREYEVEFEDKVYRIKVKGSEDSRDASQ